MAEFAEFTAGAVGSLRGEYVSSGVLPGVVTLLVVLGLASIVIAASIGPAREARRTQPAPLLRED